ncbi:MAG: hypothetical protein R2874_04155 [Desulfobacterales bacterium]
MDLEKWGASAFKGVFVSGERLYPWLLPQISRSSQKDKIDEDTRQLDFNYLKYYSLNGLFRCFSWDLIITKPNIIRRIGRTVPGKTVKLKVWASLSTTNGRFLRA